MRAEQMISRLVLLPRYRDRRRKRRGRRWKGRR
jgi:hypothetical protein